MTAMAILLGVLFIGITFIARAYEILPTVGESATTVVASSRRTSSGRAPILFYLFQAVDGADPVPRREHLVQRVPAARRRSSRSTASCRASSPFAATGSRTRGGSSSSRPSRRSSSGCSRATSTALIPLYSVGVFVCFTLSQIGMVRHWRTVRDAGWVWRLGLNAFGAALTAVVLVVVVSVKFVGRRVSRRDPHPRPGRDDAVHPPPVRRLAPRARGADGPRLHEPAPRGASRRPDPRRQPGRHPGRQRRALDLRRRPGRLHHRGPRRRGGSPRALGAPAAGRAAGGRRVAVPGADRPAARPTSTSSTPPGRPTSPRRSRSSSCRSTSPAAGGSGSSTTSP